MLHARPGINSSLWAAGNFFDLSPLMITANRIVVLALALAAVWRLCRHSDPVVRVGTSYGILLTATFLAASLSQTYYSMTLLPALLLAATWQDSPMRNPLAWFAVCGFFAFDQWVFPTQSYITEVIAFTRPTIAWTLLFLVMLVWALRHGGSNVAAAQSSR